MRVNAAIWVVRERAQAHNGGKENGLRGSRNRDRIRSVCVGHFDCSGHRLTGASPQREGRQ